MSETELVVLGKAVRVSCVAAASEQPPVRTPQLRLPPAERRSGSPDELEPCMSPPPCSPTRLGRRPSGTAAFFLEALSDELLWSITSHLAAEDVEHLAKAALHRVNRSSFPLRKPHAAIVQRTLRLLETLARRDAEGARAIVRAGAVSFAAGAIADFPPVPELLSSACTVIFLAASTPEGRAEATKLGCFEAALRTIKAIPNNPPLLASAIALIGRITPVDTEEDSRKLACNSRIRKAAVSVAVACLGAFPSDALLQGACLGAIERIAGDGRFDDVMCRADFDVVCGVLERCETPEVAAAACRCLAQLFLPMDATRGGCIHQRPLEQTAVAEAAARVLHQFAFDAKLSKEAYILIDLIATNCPAALKALVTNGALQSIVGSIETFRNEDVVFEKLLRALYAIAEDADARKTPLMYHDAVRAVTSGIEKLPSIKGSTWPMAHYVGLYCLERMALQQEAMAEAVHCGALQHVINVLGDKPPPVVGMACLISIINFTIMPEHHQAAVRYGAIEAIMEALKDPVTSEVLQYACAALWTLARTESIHSQLVMKDVLQHVNAHFSRRGFTETAKKMMRHCIDCLERKEDGEVAERRAKGLCSAGASPLCQPDCAVKRSCYCEKCCRPQRTAWCITCEGMARFTNYCETCVVRHHSGHEVVWSFSPGWCMCPLQECK